MRPSDGIQEVRNRRGLVFQFGGDPLAGVLVDSTGCSGPNSPPAATRNTSE
jgi:hypothetical protein